MFKEIEFASVYYDEWRDTWVYPATLIDTDFRVKFEATDRTNQINHIIKIYRSKRLNISINLFKYFEWQFGSNNYDHLLSKINSYKGYTGAYYSCLKRQLRKYLWIKGKFITEYNDPSYQIY